jgi:hypothetical protein
MLTSEHIADIKTMYKRTGLLDDNFTELVDFDDKINNLSSSTPDNEIKYLLETIYNGQSEGINILYNQYSNIANNIKHLDTSFESKLETHNEQKDSYLTNKRFIEITTNKNKITEFTLYLLKISLIVCACLLVFPILYKLKIMNKKITLMGWGACIFIMILIILYFVYLYNNNKNKNDFTKIDFPNPDASLIAQSKIDVDLSDGEKARCSAFAETQNEGDLDSLNNFDVDNYKVTPLKCASHPSVTTLASAAFE